VTFLAVSIDTEEDDWGGYTLDSFSVDNIQRIPRLQDLFDKYGVVPTYLVTYPVATDETSIKILGEIAKGGRCEIGTHPHPWNTPPVDEERNERNSFINNLPRELQFRKISTLHETICRNFRITPTSYRSGRWGFNGDVAGNLSRLGYLVDSSIIPYTDWSEYHGPDYTFLSAKPHALSPGSCDCEPNRYPLIEIPPSVGYLQKDQEACNRLYYRILGSPLKHLSMIGLLYRMRLLNREWLSPEKSSGPNMVKLAERMMKNGHQVLNLFFHSSSLLENRSPFVRTGKDAEEFLRRIEMFLAFARDRAIHPIKLSDAGIHIAKNLNDTRR
jgi:hypothetical protein